MLGGYHGCYCYLRNIEDLLSDGKTLCERRFEDQSRIHQFGKKVLPGLFLGYALYAGGIWEGDMLVADIEELETMDASEIYSKRLNAKEVIFPRENDNFSSRRWTIKTYWRRSGSESIHFDTGQP